ncbi:MAG: hypothetical protein ACRDOH_12720 [Streptosporangiaceae bacterium]
MPDAPLRGEPVARAVFNGLPAFFLSLGQRALSTPARTLRRWVTAVAARVTFADDSERDLGRAELLAPIERALRFLGCAAGAVALAMVPAR